MSAIVRWVGRVRNRTLVAPVVGPTATNAWAPWQTLYRSATAIPRDLGAFFIVRNHPLPCRLVVQRKPPRGRKCRTCLGTVARTKHSLANAAREREPWLLAVSPSLHALSARQVSALYAKRMQIELAFRDMKSHRYGCAFEDRLTRKRPRIAILLLIQALAGFAAWLVGLQANNQHITARLVPSGSAQRRRSYSLLRLGWEALRHHWLRDSDSALRAALRRPPPDSAATWCIT